MKTLFKIIWTLIKVVLLGFGALAVLALVLLVVAALLSRHKRDFREKSVLVFNLNTQVTDRPVDRDSALLERLLGGQAQAVQLRSAINALHESAHDDRIAALYLHGNLQGGNYSSGYAALKELREAIQDFKKSGKPVLAYIENADNRDFYLQSVADQILLNPMGLVAFHGLAASGTFLKGASDKYGLEFTPIRHGKYKSAIEPFIREDFSPENREQITALLQGIWGEMLNAVATSRKIAPEALQAVVNQEGLITARSAKDHGLVTELAYEGQALDQLRVLTGRKTNDTKLPQISMSQYAGESRRKDVFAKIGKNKIAVLYAEGQIIGGGQDMEGAVAGDRFARIIRDLRRRKDVKGLVLRVNSPGGSGQASEIMLDELRRFNAEKPVVVSMGTVAASGGYYISMASRRIFAEPDTITGSIGVFGLTMNAKKLANDHGITFDTVKTGDLADLGTLTRPMTEAEQTVMQNFVDNFYNEFIQRVGTCRKMTTNQVDELAQGRVWLGADALKNGLVDEIGGLQHAIDFAAKEANMGTDYTVAEYPEPKNFAKQLAESLREDGHPLAQQGPVARLLQTATQEWRLLTGFNDPQGIYARLPLDLDLN